VGGNGSLGVEVGEGVNGSGCVSVSASVGESVSRSAHVSWMVRPTAAKVSL
jgi:hypothetical protein